MHPGVATGTTNSSGTASIDIYHEKVGIRWVIRQLAIQVTGGGLMVVQLLVNGLPQSSAVFVSSGSAASGEPPVVLGSNDVLTVSLSNAPTSVNVTVTYYYDEMLV